MQFPDGLDAALTAWFPLPPYRCAGCRSENRLAVRANPTLAFWRRTEQPSRRGSGATAGSAETLGPDAFQAQLRLPTGTLRSSGYSPIATIHCRDVNAYGFQGPWAERRGWEQLAEAATGFADLHSAGREKSALVPAYFNDYGSGCLGALGVLVALLRRADEGGSWLARVALAKTDMLGTRFAENHEPAVPISSDRALGQK
jgi:hypothetical protein